MHSKISIAIGRSGLLWAVATVISVAQVHADDTIVLPTAASPDLDTLATEIDASMLAVANELPGSATLGSVSFDELALVTGCSAESASCRKQILATIRAKRVLVARVDSSNVRIVLVTASGAKSQQEVPVAASTTETTAAVTTAVRRLLGLKPAESMQPNSSETTETTRPGSDEDSIVEPPESPVRGQTSGDSQQGGAPMTETVGTAPFMPGEDSDQKDSFSLGKVRPLTWAVIGGGAGSLATGIIFHNLAASKQREVDDAPTNTVADVRALIELEDSVKRRSTLGFVFTAVGIAALIGGGALAVRDGRRRDQPAVTVNPLRSGGVMVGVGGWL